MTSLHAPHKHVKIFLIRIRICEQFTIIVVDLSSKWAEKSLGKSTEGSRIPKSRRKTERIRLKSRSENDSNVCLILMYLTYFFLTQVNAGPKVIDDQEVPKKLLRLMKEKDTWKEREARRKELKAVKKKSKEEGHSDLLDSSKSAM